MASSSRTLEHLIVELAIQPEREQVASELSVLQSIYGESAIHLWYPSTASRDQQNVDNNGDPNPATLRYEVILHLPSPHEDVQISVLVSLLPAYPALCPPQLQLLSKYIGAFGVDANLFGSILRTFISKSGVEWTPNTVCVFDGLQNVVESCSHWYEDHFNKESTYALSQRESPESNTDNLSPDFEVRATPIPPTIIYGGCEITEAEAITDHKSVFVGRACQITDPAQVPTILSQLMSDKRISRAAHPIINAWRCRVGTVLYQDNDDNGETAAGGRLAHLLHILEVDNVLVVVTRYFGGIPLGPLRFKHINQAARNALELGGFLDVVKLKKLRKPQ